MTENFQNRRSEKGPPEPGSAAPLSSTDRRVFEASASRGFVDWLREQHTSLAFTTYQAGRLFLIGLNDQGRLSLFERYFDRCMGLWADDNALYMSTHCQIWRFHNALEKGQTHNGYDRLYIPRVAYTTGDLDAHDISVDRHGRIIFVNTSFSCLATADHDHSFAPLWHPPFISRLAPEDRCHLNGLAMEEGVPRFVTAVSQSDIADGWRDRRHDGGTVVDLATNEIVASGLSMPHSPRVYRGRLWLLDSGTGYLGWIDPVSARFERQTFCPGYARGLSFLGNYAIVGLSKPRDGTFTGLELQNNLAQCDGEARCGLIVVDLSTGHIVEWLRIEGVIEELYDVVALPRASRPMALGFKTAEIRRIVTIGEEQPLLTGDGVRP